MKYEDLKVGDYVYLKPKSECSGEFLSVPYIGVFDNNMHEVAYINYRDRVFNVFGDDYWYHFDWIKKVVPQNLEGLIV